MTLTFDLLTLNFYHTSCGLCFTLNSAKFERNRIIHGSVIGHLARFRMQFFLGEGGRTDRAFSGCVGPNFTKLDKDIGRSLQHCTHICIFVSDFGYLAAFSNASGAKLSDVSNDAKFRALFDSL